MALAGGCLCGAVRYEAKGEPDFQGMCNCERCQRSSGSAFIPFIGVKPENFTVTGDYRTYGNPDDPDAEGGRNFCPSCGATMFGSGPDFITIYAGSLDDPAQFAPTHQIFVRSRRAWSSIPHGSLEEHDAANW